MSSALHSASLPWQFGTDMSDIRRELERAEPAARPARFRERSREGICWSKLGVSKQKL
jgi:hypothetical protein